MRLTRLLLLMLSPLFLTACAFHQYILAPKGWDNHWKPEPDTVVVLLGTKADEHVRYVYSIGDPAYDVTAPFHRKGVLNVLALHRKVGETFQLEKVAFSEKNNLIHYASFDNAPVLNVDKPGIYYYGSFTSYGERSYLTTDFDPAIVDVAKDQYPYLFEQAKPVNF